jgi:hypothetical protein
MKGVLFTGSKNVDNSCFSLSFFSFLLLLPGIVLYSLRCSPEAKVHELTTSAREQGGLLKQLHSELQLGLLCLGTTGYSLGVC